MFALPFTAPSHDSLAGHVFGRFLSRGTPADGGDGAASVASPVMAAAVEDDIPDLAQRVREVGEW